MVTRSHNVTWPIVVSRSALACALGLVLLLAGCATPGPQSPPPPATPAQIEKEMRYLHKSFLGDPCMAALRAAAPELRPADQAAGKTLYAIEFPPSLQAQDRSSHRLYVTERDRLAYLHTSGGVAGWYTVRGPLPLWRCMREALRP